MSGAEEMIRMRMTRFFLVGTIFAGEPHKVRCACENLFSQASLKWSDFRRRRLTANFMPVYIFLGCHLAPRVMFDCKK